MITDKRGQGLSVKIPQHFGRFSLNRRMLRMVYDSSTFTHHDYCGFPQPGSQVDAATETQQCATSFGHSGLNCRGYVMDIP